MMSPDERLVHMANQIARNLAAQGHEKAVAMLADHIVAFWDPRMKARLFAMQAAPLDRIAADAIALLARPDVTTANNSVLRREPPNPAGGSDAG